MRCKIETCFSSAPWSGSNSLVNNPEETSMTNPIPKLTKGLLIKGNPPRPSHIPDHSKTTPCTPNSDQKYFLRFPIKSDIIVSRKPSHYGLSLLPDVPEQKIPAMIALFPS